MEAEEQSRQQPASKGSRARKDVPEETKGGLRCLLGVALKYVVYDLKSVVLLNKLILLHKWTP